jgi:hypothetical protein
MLRVMLVQKYKYLGFLAYYAMLGAGAAFGIFGYSKRTESVESFACLVIGLLVVFLLAVGLSFRLRGTPKYAQWARVLECLAVIGLLAGFYFHMRALPVINNCPGGDVYDLSITFFSESAR